MKKLYICVVAAVLLGFASLGTAATLDGLGCSRATGGPAPSSFLLLRKAPGETVFTQIDEKTTCDFAAQTVVDTGETCFIFGAKNSAGTSLRSEVTICINPLNFPLSAPVVLKVK